mgnify:CR=1 FL=1
MEYSFKTQGIGLKTVINARELGGYVLPDGRRIKHGLLLRGGALDNASDEDLSCLSDKFRVKRIFDFRTSGEVGFAPDKYLPGADYVWMPAFDEESSMMEQVSLPKEAYRDLKGWLSVNAWMPDVQRVAREMYPSMVMSDFTRIQYTGFLQNIIKTTDGAVYWHCSQGKDRTGLGAALLLAALGADRTLIMQDYAISNEFYVNDVEEAWSHVDTEAEKEAILTFVGVNSKYFSGALDLLEKECGSMEAFLKGPLCLSDEDLAILRDRYLE